MVKSSPAPTPDPLFLPTDYVRRTSAVALNTNGGGEAYWGEGKSFNASESQWHVYEWARVSMLNSANPVVWDIGCGMAVKLHRLIASHPSAQGFGFDQPYAIGAASRIASDRLKLLACDLESFDSGGIPLPTHIICADVIEHLQDPASLLRRILGYCQPDTSVFVSTPDRTALHGPANRSPSNPLHVQEWTPTEFGQLVQSSGFAVESIRHFPPMRLGLNFRSARLYGHLLFSRLTTRITMSFHLRPADRTSLTGQGM
jgi:hypothetical protein